MRTKSVLFIFTGLFIAGILAHGFAYHYFGWAAGILIMLLAFSYHWRQERILFPVLIAIVWLLAGFVYTHSYTRFRSDHVFFAKPLYSRGPIRVEGRIVSEPQSRIWARGVRTGFVVELKRLEQNHQWTQHSGRVWVDVYRTVPLRYGDQVILIGKLHRPYDFASSTNFSYKKHLSRQGILFLLTVKKNAPIVILAAGQGHLLNHWAIECRQRLITIFDQHLPSEEAGFVRALVMGERSGLSKETKTLFVHTGTAHIIAISGLNVGVVVAMIFLFLKMLPVPRPCQYILTIFFLFAYTILTGASPSVVRAAIMAAVFLLGFVIERETNSLNSLALAALLILLLDPMTLFDIGFQLSFLSVLSIIVLYPVVHRFLSKKLNPAKIQWLEYFVQSLALSSAAWFGVAGLIVHYFAIVTPVSFLANLLIVPITTLLVILGSGMILLNLILPKLLFTFGACIHLLFQLMMWSVYCFDKIPGAYFYFYDIPLWAIQAYYVFLVWGFFYWSIFIKRDTGWSIDKERQLC